jgi:soluble lytic murein transglycosylase
VTASTLLGPRSTFVRLLAGASLAGLLSFFQTATLSAQGNPGVDTAAVMADAAKSMQQDRPYRASRLLMRLVRGPGEKDPALLLLAANAAAGWEGWGTVVRLLDDQPWLDRVDDGAGRALLARARVERGEDAVADAQAALRDAGSAAAGEGARLVTLARAYDRMHLLDSAAAAYNRAAARLPLVADWLLLRSAGVLADSAARAELYRSVSLPAATARIPWTEVLARERTGDEPGAARVYESLGATLAAARLRLAGTPDSAACAVVRRALVGLLTSRSSTDEARDAIGILDRSFAPLTSAEELAVARRAATANLPARAVQGFSRNRPLSDADQFAYGQALARLSRHREAMTAFAAIKSPGLRTQAQYQRARSLLRVGTRGAAIAALRRVARGTVRDSGTAAMAGFLAADLLVDQGDETAARTAYLEVARRFPTTVHGSRGALVAAIIALSRRETRDAVRELTRLAERPGDGSETAAANYWAGFALALTEDTAAARARWRAVLERFPQSYYALPARGRLGIDPPPLPEGSVPPASEQTNRALERAALLERLGLKVEARFEIERVAREAEAAPASLAATAGALAGIGQTARSFRLALRVTDPGLARLAFPIPRRADLFDEAKAAGVDPLLAAALIRQESEFNPAARSPADARGLMQVVPSVGAAFARANGLLEWDASLLYQPEINVHFGLAHLANSLRRSPHLAHALAAYNAGTRAADQWAASPGARSDPELFIERIQFAETRDYVRRILRYQATYRSLYPVAP